MGLEWYMLSPSPGWWDRMMGYLLLLQLPASGQDVCPAAFPYKYRVVMVSQNFLKREDGGFCGSFIRRAGEFVKGDEIDLAAYSLQEPCNAVCIFRGVIQPCEEYIFKAQHPPSLERIFPACLEEFGHRVFLVNGHDEVPLLICGGIEGDSQVDVKTALPELSDLRHQTGCREGNPPCADGGSK